MLWCCNYIKLHLDTAFLPFLHLLGSKLFKDIDEMLLRLYYLYEKSPKKCRELEDVVSELKEVYEFPKTGNMSSLTVGH